ncbi:MAG: hypothetical protein FJ292_03520 [Planctomycetes bacterium]|nr:hypothetical protein [Planctomycetota bacterium]
MSTVRRLSIASLSTLALALLTGCGDPVSLDPQLAASKKFDEALSKARKVLAEVAVADPAANRTSADALRSAARSMTSPPGATQGQQAALALSSAQLLREAARLDTVAIEQLQSKQRSAADQIVSALQGARSLKQLQGAMPSGDDEQSQTLQKAIDDASALATEAESQAQTARGEADAKQAIATEQGHKATDLEGQAAKKRAAASAARTSAEAQSLTQEAAALSTQAIDARQAAATAEIVVLNLSPEADRMQKRAEALRAKVARLQADREALEAVTASRTKANSSLSDASRSAMQRASAAADALEKVSAELKALLTESAESLESAANSVQRGGPGAKLSAASIHLAQAMLHERWAGGASMEAYAFDAMATASGDSKWSKLAATAREDRTAAMAKALTALEAADSDLSGDTSSASTSLRTRVAEARKALEGPKSDTPAEAAPADAGSAAPAGDGGEKPAEAPAADGGDEPADAPAADTPAQPAAEPTPEPAPGR